MMGPMLMTTAPRLISKPGPTPHNGIIPAERLRKPGCRIPQPPVTLQVLHPVGTAMLHSIQGSRRRKSGLGINYSRMGSARCRIPICLAGQRRRSDGFLCRVDIRVDHGPY